MAVSLLLPVRPALQLGMDSGREMDAGSGAEGTAAPLAVKGLTAPPYTWTSEPVLASDLLQGLCSSASVGSWEGQGQLQQLDYQAEVTKCQCTVEEPW